LASSATRNAIYNCFKLDNRENIGDITAKGEAQIAVVDLLGIGAGIGLSKAMGISSVKNILLLYLGLQTMEIFAMYKEIRSVVFSVLNFERLYTCVDTFVCSDDKNDSSIIPTPSEMAKAEKIFLPPNHLARRNIAFGSFSRVYLNPSELKNVQEIFCNEKYLVLAGENLKKKSDVGKVNIEDQCHIVLHTEAKNIDIVKSTLALALLRSKLIKRYSDSPKTVIRTNACFDLLQEIKNESNELFPKLLSMLLQRGWNTPAKNMFGSSSIRADWTIYTDKKKVTSDVQILNNIDGNALINGDSIASASIDANTTSFNAAIHKKAA